MRFFSRRGFALSELFVLVAFAALILGLSLPAIQKLRETSNRTRCANNLRLLGTGVQGFVAANEQLLPHNQLSAPYGSWNTQLLVYLGEEKLAKEYNPGHEWWASEK